MESKLIISRFKENLDWVPLALDVSGIEEAEVFNKGQNDVNFSDPRIKVTMMENVGREGATYIDYILRDYRKLPDKIWMAQGNPFDHSPDFIDLMGSKEHYINQPFQCLSARYSNRVPPAHLTDQNTFLNIKGLRCCSYFIKDINLTGHCDDFHDHPLHKLLNSFERKYGTTNFFGYLSDRIGIANPRKITEFCWSACFYTRGSSILRHPRWVYQRLRDFLLESGSQGSFQGYIVERYWNYLLTGRSFETIADSYRSILENRITVAYCKKRGKVWIKDKKNLGAFRDPNMVIFLEEGVIQGIDVIGRDLEEHPVSSYEEAMRLANMVYQNQSY